MAKKKVTDRRKSAPRKNRKQGGARPPSVAKGGRDAASGFAVVGIGASAGGLEAFRQFFEAMPSDSGMAFVLVMHLDPTHSSLVAELIGGHTDMPVTQAEDGMQVEADHVYVIPPNCYITISGEHLHLSEPIERRGIRVPVDFFLRSLAEEMQERAIGIILSGTGSDGTHGVREIKAGGGMVLAQSPESAEYDGMPHSAVSAGVVDYVLPTDMMPEVLCRYVRHWYIDGASSLPASKKPDHLNTIIGLLRTRVQYDFSCYKKGTLIRRVQRRMGLSQIDNMTAYIEILRKDNEEVTALYKDLLIGVTNFFREPEAWQELAQQVIVPLIQAHSVDEPIRVWVPGCATGEEAYSIAMSLIEQMHVLDKGCDLYIFASDIDQDALAFARAGVYSDNISAHVSADRLRQFFVKGEHTHRINKDVRDLVVFAEQNLVSDPPFSKLDLISCRNLLIYIEPNVQKKILGLFHFALRPGGCLFLGNAETVGERNDLFNPLSRKWRIYRQLGPARHEGLSMTLRSSDNPPLPVILPSQPVEEHHKRRLATIAQHALLQRYAPACVLVDRKGQVFFLNGPVDDYLQLPAGELAADLFAMARPGLRTKLRSALQQATHEVNPVVVSEARVKRGRKYYPVRLRVEPLRQPTTAQGLLLVAFEEAGQEHPQARVVYVEQSEPELLDKPSTAEEYEAVIRHLDVELGDTREDLQTTIEELETSNEEFKAANEEVTSINEELQSTNEELETSKEELQSMNEELQTVNSQLESKLGELESTNNDLQNLVQSIDSPILFLDRQLRIKRFTPATTALMRLIDTDIGRPFSDFSRNIDDSDLLSDAEQVLKQLTPAEKEIHSGQSNWYLRRIVPYRTEDDRIDGVIITFWDISARKAKEQTQHLLTERLDQLVSERTQVLKLVSDLAAGANEAVTLEEAIGGALERICRENGWHVGYTYFASADGREYRSSGIRVVTEAEGLDLEKLDEAITNTTITLSSPSWIATAARERKVQWLTDLDADPRRSAVHEQALALGLRMSIACPVSAEHQTVAVMVFFSREQMPPDARFVQAMEDVGQQLGQVVRRNRLERQLVEATDREQRRFGQELHDSLGQNLSAIGMMSSAILMDLQAEDSPFAERYAGVVRQIEKANVQLRSQVSGMIAEELGVDDLLRELQGLADNVDMTYGIACSFDYDPSGLQQWGADSFTVSQILRIAQEAVHNAIKHAAAKHIGIRMLESGRVGISVFDDGIGISDQVKPLPGHGMMIMRYRAALIGAELRLETSPGAGTTVTCVFVQPAA